MYQFFAPLIEPIGAIWLLMLVVVGWLLWRRQWRNAILAGAPTILLFILGSTSVAERLAGAQESAWTNGFTVADQSLEATGGPPADVVVALGGGDRVSQNDLLGFAVEGGYSRVLTAVQLVRAGKARTLVLGGSWPMPGKPGVPSMRVVQDWISSWGLAAGAVTNLGICVNTHDEALAFREMAQAQGWSNVILVTSALHMRRSMALFKKEGIEATPVAADFLVCGVSQDLPFSPFPRQRRLYLLGLYLHEKIGWWAYRARGWI